MNQLATNLKTARARRNAAMVLIERSRRQRSTQWIAKAVEALREFYRGRTESMTIEAARVQIGDKVPFTSEARWWGLAAKEALRLGYLAHRPGDYAPTASSNLSPRAAYIGGPNA